MLTCGIISQQSSASPRGDKRPRNTLAQGSVIIKRKCEEKGFHVLDLTERWESVDVIMVSLFWYEHFFWLINLLFSRGIEINRIKRDKRPIIFAGGQLVGYNPSVFMSIVDLCCIGDGEESAPKVLDLLSRGNHIDDCASIPGIFSCAMDNETVWQNVDDISMTLTNEFHDSLNFMDENGFIKNRKLIRAIEIARGCKHKCLYCGLSWTKKYRENKTDDIVRELRAAVGGVKCFAPSYFEHSGWPEIGKEYDKLGKYNQARDITSKTILTCGFGKSRIYTTGIDGISERIRFAIAKSLSKSNLMKIINIASKSIASLGYYLILDLPGEDEKDFEEWFLSIVEAEYDKDRVIEKHPRALKIQGGFSHLVTLNMFCPTPHTPLQWEGINLESKSYRMYLKFLNTIIGPPADGKLLRHKILGKPHGAVSRLLETAIIRGDNDLSDFLIKIVPLRNRFKNIYQIFLLAKKMGVKENLENVIEKREYNNILPWRRRVKTFFTDEQLLKGRQKYYKNMGLQWAERQN